MLKTEMSNIAYSELVKTCTSLRHAADLLAKLQHIAGAIEMRFWIELNRNALQVQVVHLLIQEQLAAQPQQQQPMQMHSVAMTQPPPRT